ncbi:hypothetical protein [Polyangium spumosum]|uniref:Uncharacterized protein n=1 Tax=Polyangium spumosum TaxID=889282 RepID=A0A6N7PPX7_9BACT|nr:hypothetical protein [Polyangium spumosum]MRG92255.1 hypothetical protein [Polyangium spumosum]
MVRVLSGISALLVVSLLGCSSQVSGGGSPSDGATGTSTSTGAGSSGGVALEITTCAELDAELAKERQAIMSCTSDAECGQDLKGTSCGCTRNLVARLDADTTRFYELLQRGQDLECDPGLVSTCDCPNANGFVCKSGTCGWNYVP